MTTKLVDAIYFSTLTWCLPAGSRHLLQSVIPRVLWRNDAHEREAPCRPVSPSGRKQIPVSSVTQLSPHRRARQISFNRQNISWFTVTDSEHFRSESPCTFPSLTFGNCRRSRNILSQQRFEMARCSWIQNHCVSYHTTNLGANMFITFLSVRINVLISLCGCQNKVKR